MTESVGGPKNFFVETLQYWIVRLSGPAVGIYGQKQGTEVGRKL